MKVMFDETGKAVKVVPDDYPVAARFRVEHVDKLTAEEWVRLNCGESSDPPKRSAFVDGLLAIRMQMDEAGAPDYPGAAKRPRFFIDTLTITGDAYLIPANRRGEWHAFDCACEETHEQLPVPEWARPIEQLSHLEFEAPQDIFK